MSGSKLQQSRVWRGGVVQRKSKGFKSARTEFNSSCCMHEPWGFCMRDVGFP